MSEEGREPIGFQTSASEAQNKLRELLSSLEAGEASYAELSETLGNQVAQLNERVENAYSSYHDDASTPEMRSLHLDRVENLTLHISILIVGQLAAGLGQDISKIHQRLAEVEKVLREIRRSSRL